MPDLLDDSVTENQPVRFMAADVERLDLVNLGFTRAQAAFTGGPADAPRDVLQLATDGYLNRIRSRRRLERETHRHVETVWLLRKLRPDFQTVADFRKNNPKTLQALFREFVLLCRQLDLFGAELLASDGSTFKAVNNTHKNFTQAKLEKALKEVGEKVEQYLRDLDAVDSQHKLMVEQDVTHAITDDDQLSPMAIRAEETLGVERIRAVADMGYYRGHEIKACEEAGIEAYVPNPSTSANTTRGLFGQERFTSDP